jgi:2-polyprenyl-6-methoxyphenol hydroxylase-like FAD-dependent oxidoreductase
MNTQQTSTSQCRALVVGAGPTGLVLAAQLLARGIETRIIDKAELPSEHSRAVGVHARTLELLDTMGLAESFVEHGHQVRRFRMYADHHTLLNLDMARNGSRYGFILHLPQKETERLLRARVAELGGTIEQSVELVRLVERGGTVDVTLHDAAGRETEYSADYVIGCDGAHSRVRHELGLAFEGQPYPQDWLLADVSMDGVGRDDETHLFFRSNGLPLVCLSMGQGRWRVVLPNAGERAGRQPTFDEIQELVDQRAPRRIVVSDPGWMSCYRVQMRTVASYRSGRVLLAGDAAHIHSPAGGQGMNTGMMDANNLAWKLALVANGAPVSLLDSYEQERRPAASNVLGFTDKIHGWSTMRHPVKRALRDILVPAVTSVPSIQRRAARRLSQVSVGYPSSAVIRYDAVRRGPLPGERMPDIEVSTSAERTSLYHALRHGRHVLVVSGVEMRGALVADGLDLLAGMVDVVDGELRLPYAVGKEASFVLVRPDGVVAARGSRSDVGAVIDYLQRFSAQTPHFVELAEVGGAARVG